MVETGIIRGRVIGPADLAQVSALLAEHPDWSRRRISESLARLWNWRNPAGQLKDMVARTLLLKLEARGWIELPARRRVPNHRMRSQRRLAWDLLPDSAPIVGELGPLLHGHPIYLLVTFVDPSRFQGRCYRAANWIPVGQTTGRTRQNKTLIPQAPPKAVWLRPLREDFRSALCAS